MARAVEREKADGLGVEAEAGAVRAEGGGEVAPVGGGVRGRELTGRLGGLTLPQQVLVLAVWPMLEQLLSFLVGTVDLALAGHLEPGSTKVAATDALGVAAYVTWLLAMIHSAVGVGATALIARAVGGSHRRLVNAALGQGMVLAAVVGVAVGLGTLVLAGVLGRLAGLEGESLYFCRLYLSLMAIAEPFSALLLVSAAAMRGSGDTRTPFMVMVVVNVLNVVASLALVYGPGVIGGHGVAGIAGGTVIAWGVGAVMIVGVLIRGDSGLRLHLHRLRPHAHTLRRIVRVSVPNLAESVLAMWLGNFLVLVILGRLGQEGIIGAHMVAVQVEAVSVLSGVGMGIAAATLCGQYLGLGDVERARRAVKLCWGIGAGVMGACGVVFLLGAGALAGVITDSPFLLERAVGPIRIAGPIQVFFATYLVLAGAMRGAGDTRMTMWLTAGSIFLVRVPAVYVAAMVLGGGLNAVWVALCGELVVRGVIFAGRFLHGGWAKVQV